ncbi:hypothetical protein A2U01_0106880, partial [Trifolium medium]|nr:hypothetical protein [Trifolium medium]
FMQSKALAFKALALNARGRWDSCLLD